MRMRDYFKIWHLVLKKAGIDYIIYLLLCGFEVIRNLAILFSAYWGTTLLANADNRGNGVPYLVGGLLTSVVCELAVIGINHFMNKTEERIERLLYQELLRRSGGLPLARLQDHCFQVLFRDVLEEGKAAVVVLAMNVSSHFPFICNMLIYVFVALRAGWGFVVVSLVCVGMAHFCVARVESVEEESRTAQSLSRNRRKYYSDLLDREKNHVEVVGHGASGYFSARLEESYRSFLQASNRIKKRHLVQRMSASLAIGAGALASLFLLFWQRRYGSLGAELFFVILLAEILLFQEVGRWMRTLTWDKEALHFARKYLEFLRLTETTSEITVPAEEVTPVSKGLKPDLHVLEAVSSTSETVSREGETSQIRDFAGETAQLRDSVRETSQEWDCKVGVLFDEIRLMDVCLDYGEKRAVDGVSLTLRKGQKTLLIGENGSGKTSLLNLLAGLFEPTGGRIDVSVKCSESPESQVVLRPECLSEFLKRQTAYVSQSFPMLAISVRDSFFCPAAGDAEIWNVLEQVELKEKVASAAEGLDAVVGKEIFFSKGQWQRLIVARLLVHKDRSIWILDEPTSAMDALREEKVLRTIFEAAREKVVVIVSHRLGLASEVDQIIHMDAGNVFAAGTHHEMLRTDARYREAYESQRQIYSVESEEK